MSIESDLKKDGIEVIGSLSTSNIDKLAHDVAEKICKAFPSQNFIFQNLYIALSKIPMYIAKIPDGFAEANYFYKNSSIYFKAGIPIDELEKYAIHEIIHYLQEIKDKKGNIVKLGLCNFRDFNISGMALNEGAVQLMTSKTLKQEQEIVKYYGISFPTTSPNYYPILCNLVEQMGYITGEEILFDSTFYGTDLFKKTFSELCGSHSISKIQNNLDKIMDIEEKILNLNQKLVSDNCEGNRAKRITNKISNLKESLNDIYFKTQDLIYTSYFDTQYSKIITTADIDSYRFKLYNYKNYIGIKEDYSKFNEYYIDKMIDLDSKYENIINNTALVVKKKSSISYFFKQLLNLFGANLETQK